MRALWLVPIAVMCLAVPLHAQCPDGTPLPCGPRRAALGHAPNSIAVLYFDNLTRDSAYAYLADGLSEDLITMLGRVPRLEVRSRHESARVRGLGGRSPVALARTLNVAFLLTGSVQPAMGRLRVNAELVEGRTGRRLWVERVVAGSADPLAAQESVAAAVVRAVTGTLLPEERATLARRPSRDSAAYDL